MACWKMFFEFYGLLATRFPLHFRYVSQRGARRYVPISVTVLTALSIHLFRVGTFSVAFFNAFCSVLFCLAVSYVN